MKIKVKKPITKTEIEDNRKLLKSPAIAPNSPWPDSLKNAVAAWKYLGNPWLTSMECNMALSTKGVRFETDIDLNDIRLLEHLGFMQHSQLGFQDFWCRRYKLNERGLRLIPSKTIEEPKEEKTTATKFKVKKLEPKIIEQTELVTPNTKGECKNCKGSGWDDKKDDDCKVCYGTGYIIPVVSSPGRRGTSKSTVRIMKRK